MEKEFLRVEHAEPDLSHQMCEITDDAGQESALRSDTFLNSAFFAPESVLPHAFLLQHSEPEEPEREIPKRTQRRFEIVEETPSPPSRIGLIASMSVGMLVAIFLFPMVRFAERSTRSYVTTSFTSEIGRRVDQYEQLNSTLTNVDAEELLPINLALTGWKELRFETLMPFQEIRYVPTPQEFTGIPLAQIGNAYLPVPIANENISDYIPAPLLPFLEDTEGWNIATTADANGVANHKLLVLQGQENFVRLAFGQYFHFTDARIFVRELSNLESQQR